MLGAGNYLIEMAFMVRSLHYIDGTGTVTEGISI